VKLQISEFRLQIEFQIGAASTASAYLNLQFRFNLQSQSEICLLNQSEICLLNQSEICLLKSEIS